MIYSIFPAAVALYFLIAGLVVNFRFSKHSSHFAFIALCATTFVWQFTWAILFQVNDPAIADVLIKTGYLLIVFLPTSIYHFLAEIANIHSERKYVYYSYIIAGIFAVFIIFTDMFVSGHYSYFFGFYPKAGVLHPLHVVQTIIVTMRGLYLIYEKQKAAIGLFREQLRYCLVSLLIYTFAAVDYLCNYGVEFYPPGIIFITIGLSIFLYALLKKELMTNLHQVLTREHEEKISLLKALAANIAHELRTPLATIHMDAKIISPYIPDNLSNNIIKTVRQANFTIDMLLANLRSDKLDSKDYGIYSIKACIDEAISSYPFQKGEKDKITHIESADFDFHGSDVLFIYVINNLLKNALYSVSRAMKGHIEIWMDHEDNMNRLHFRDTGSGISKKDLPYVFDNFYSSKPAGVGHGLGLGFCDRVMNSFGGSIELDSQEGDYCELILRFPGIEKNEKPVSLLSPH
ncbi:MAG TPA: ATP-binding protein [Chitinophagaceae bacterium]|nr:ATP-binding protein [Chitinophagaceae bacterium]